MVTFSVYKSSKYLFDCVVAIDSNLSILCTTENLNAFEALRLLSVNVIKRMDFYELDKLVTCCKGQLIQVFVKSATQGDIAPFEKFSKYLKSRQRAGVALLADKRLFVLAPVEESDYLLRCLVLKAEQTPEAPATLPLKARARSFDKTASDYPLQTEFDPKAKITLQSEPELASETGERGQIRPSSFSREQRQDIADNSHQNLPLPISNNQKVETKVKPLSAATNHEVALLSSLPRIERATKIAQLRQEYGLFHEHHYNILQEWSKSVSN